MIHLLIIPARGHGREVSDAGIVDEGDLIPAAAVTAAGRPHTTLPTSLARPPCRAPTRAVNSAPYRLYWSRPAGWKASRFSIETGQWSRSRSGSAGSIQSVSSGDTSRSCDEFEGATSCGAGGADPGAGAGADAVRRRAALSAACRDRARDDSPHETVHRARIWASAPGGVVVVVLLLVVAASVSRMRSKSQWMFRLIRRPAEIWVGTIIHRRTRGLGRRA